MASFNAAGSRAAETAPGFLFQPQQNIIPAPSNPKDWPAFLSSLRAWRDETRRRLSYSDALYRREEFSWVTGNFSCCFLMLCDAALYDPVAGRYTVDSVLEQGVLEFGGYDSLVLWHAYPRIGADARNQFDFYRDMPGGLAGLRGLTRRCHRRGVRVFVDYNPWDTGTRREGKPDLEALAELVGEIEADGIFLDTMDRGAREFRALLDARRRGVVLEGEGALPLENIHDHHLSWAQWFADSSTPGVLRNKWFERRHLQHQIRRWDHDHTGELQTAWMNGSGMLVWENVFGQWVGWSQRDRALYRLMLPIQRRYRHLFTGEGWTPLIATEQPDVYASLWEGPGQRLWTLVNRSAQARGGWLLKVPGTGALELYDLIQGRRADAQFVDGQWWIKGQLSPRGIGAFIEGSRIALGRDFTKFLARQARPCAGSSSDARPPLLVTRLKPAPPTRPSTVVPAEMAEVQEATFTMKAEFRVREVGFYETASDFPSGFPRLHQPVTFERQVTLRRYAMDLTPVTNAQFAAFLKAANYRPRHRENFLAHWIAGRPPAGQEDHPVVYVDLEDARAYASWAGKRLPTEEEWQYAAQGPQALRYPWGNEMRAGCCNQGETGQTTSVKAFPAGRSFCGLYDLCGNTWEWTESERTDGRTRFCILKGGAAYRARGSDWYFDGGPQPNQFAAKYLLMWPGLDRCATIGFRCALGLY